MPRLAYMALFTAALATIGASAPRPSAAGSGHAVDPRHAFGLQNIPKFDERGHHGGWNGTRTRGLAMRRDLGTGVGREGFIWAKFQPDGPRPGRYTADFDDAVNTVLAGHMTLEAMVTETPAWAATARDPKHNKDSPPKGLALPTFADGTDTPAPGKKINPANTWAQGLAALAERYHGKVTYWQVWNEPDYPEGKTEADESNARRTWTGSVQEYARLLHVSRSVLRSRDPGAKIATGGLGYAGYLDAMLAAGAGPDFDFVDFHAYGWPGSDAALAAFDKVHDEMGAVLAKHGARKGMICSETGYSSSEPQEQADYLAKLLPTALDRGVAATMVYADVNPCWRNMGLVDWRTMTQKTAGYWAFKNAAAALADVRRVEPLRQAGLAGYRFDRPGNRPLYIVWAPHATQARPVSLAVGGGSWQVHDATGKSLGVLSGPKLQLQLTSSPRFIDGDARQAYTAPVANPPIQRNGLAFAAVTADSSAPNTGAPPAAADGDPDTSWNNGTFKASEAWIRFSLAAPRQLHALHVKTGPLAPNTWYDVETSMDGAHFTTAASHLQPRSWHMESVPLTPSQARYIRLRWHNPDRAAVHFGVFELEAT